ncbi:hypothetical protein JTB14_020262 [Gonioctena quinquepunctata]|nr:hypothetical protein JTB14_020262 [Gonioctena quinquepunctata]
MSKAEVLDAKNKEADIQTSFALIGQVYPKQLKTPINNKLRQKFQFRFPLQVAKEEYYKTEILYWLTRHSQKN